MLSKYIRNVHGDRVGVIVAIGKDQVGWSVCSPNDVFDHDLGHEIAIGRAIKGTSTLPPMYRQDIECNIFDEIDVMVNRSFRYFK